MHDQPKYIPLRASTFFIDGRSARPLVADTVARGTLHDDPHFYSGKVNGRDVDSLPFPVTRATLVRGQERFDIFCSPCHGRTGDGDGMIVRRGYRRPPSFDDERLRQTPVGHLFDVVSNGFGAMPDYAAQIPAFDRWAIVTYVRALQLSRHVAVGNLPPEDRARLNRQAAPTPGGDAPGR